VVSGISLSNKCQLLFGFSVVVILTAALTVPWIRTQSLVSEYQVEVSRQLADAWLAGRVVPDGPPAVDPGDKPAADAEPPDAADPRLHIDLVGIGDIRERGPDDAETGDDPGPAAAAARAERRFLVAARRAFEADDEVREHVARIEVEDQPVYWYARAMRAETAGDDAGRLEQVLLVARPARFAEGQLLVSRIFIIAAGLVASLLAVLVFYLILTKLILSPVRRLRQTAEKVQKGDLAIRSEIRTGDEFEQMSEAFNAMLDRVGQTQAQLRTMNETLDLKIGELSEANVGLYESNRLKSEFLAGVSHELRTPLNSIIGFTELLDEIVRGEDEPNPRRLRYLSNILTSARGLLEMINELLDMAKIEAGRMEVNIEPTSVGDLVEGLTGLMGPPAREKRVALRTEIGRHVPMIETDPGKLQQILYNFLSNAIKFTPEDGTVTLTADRVTRQDSSLGVRLGVSDTGPGIPPDMQDVIFEKFRQADAGHTREHAGTGLGLAICRELAELLGATVSFVSEPGRGATFFVDLPLTFQPDEPQPLMA
jgi:signal transduction histidine kinase